MPQILLIAQPTPNGMSLTWSEGPAAFPSYELSRKSLVAAAEGARKALGAVVECFFSPEDADDNAAALALAQAGYALYQALFKPAAEQQAQANEVRKWLDKLHTEGAIESLEVVSDGVEPVPWNLVYDRRPDPNAFRAGGDDPIRWQPFWGQRYDLSGGTRVSPLRRFPVLQNPRVVIVSDPFVLDNMPTESRELAALCQEHNWPHARSRAELTEALQAGRPDILYWLGHTQTDPFGLVLGEDVITPDELRVLLEGDPFADAGEVFGGVAFLNACGTAQRNATGSFPEALHPLGLSGYIATEQVTIDTFAAPLGREFLNAFAVRGEPLGRLMRHLRGRVPLGLLYGSYCPPMIRVRHGNAAGGSGESGSIVVTKVAGGTKLGRGPNPAPTAGQPLPTHPYRSLRAYSAGDRALFAGRDEDVLRFAQILDDPGTRLLVLHGESGVGKTSFLRAGLMPYLEHECAGYRFTRDRGKEDDSILLVRATNDPVSQLAAALTAYCAKPLTYPTPLGEHTAADLPAVLHDALGGREGHDALRDALRADPSLLGRLLAALALVLPFTPVLVIDQAEEVFTLARTADDELNRTQALEMLRRAATGPGGFKLIVCMRTEYYGRFTDRLRKGSREAGGVRDYLLTDFGLEALIEMIRRPTSTASIEYASEVPFEKYRFRYADSVAEEIARRARAYTINRQDSVLPLVQVICTQLYDRAKSRADGTITLADLEVIGGVEGGMRAHAEGLVRRLFPQSADQRAFRRLLADPTTQLFIRQSDGTLTTALLPAEFLARHWSGRMPFEQMLQTAGDGDWRLLRVNSLRIGSDDGERPYVSLGHDALARVAAGWADERKRRAQLRKYAIALVTLAVIVGALTALTGWALEQSAEATRRRGQAEVAGQQAKDSERVANEQREEAKNRAREADEQRAQAEAKKREADEQRAQAKQLGEDALVDYRTSMDDALGPIGPAAQFGPNEQTYLNNTRKRWEDFANRQKTDEARDAIRAEGHHRVGLLSAKFERWAEARTDYEAARDLWAVLVARHPENPAYRHSQARIFNSLGVTHANLRNWSDAEAAHDRAQAIQAALVKEDPGKPLYRNALADTFNNKGLLFAQLKRAPEAIDAYGKAIRLQSELVREAGDDPSHKHTLARTHNNLGLLHTELGRAKQASNDPTGARESRLLAREEYLRAIVLQEELVIKSPVPVYQNALARTLNNVGAMLTELPDWNQARDMYKKAHDLLEPLSADVPGYRTDLGYVRWNYGRTFRDRNELSERLMWFDRAVEVLQPPHPAQPAGVARRHLCGIYEDRARTHRERAELPEAVADWGRAIELSSPDDRPRLRAERAFARLYTESGFTDAVKELDALTGDPAATWDGEMLYRFAVAYALVCNAVGNRDEKLWKHCRDQAMKALLRAVEKGWGDADLLKPGTVLYQALYAVSDFERLRARLQK